MNLLRNSLIAGIFLAIIAAGVLWFFVNDTRVMGAVLHSAARKAQRAVDVRGVSIRSLKYTFPSTWLLKDVRVDMRLKARALEIFAAEVDLPELMRLLLSKEDSTVVLRGVEIVYDKLKVNDLSLTVLLRRSPAGTLAGIGTVAAAGVSWDKFNALSVSAAFAGDAGSLTFTEGTADIFGGKVSARGKFMFATLLEYAFFVSLKDVDALALERALGRDSREFVGRLSGRGEVQGVGDRITVLDAALDMPAGGEVSAAFLSSIASYLPSSVQKKRLDSLILSGGRLAVEIFSFTIRSDAPDHLSGEIGLKSREANIELNISHEIKVDARVDSLLRTWQLVMDSWQKGSKPAKGSQ